MKSFLVIICITCILLGCSSTSVLTKIEKPFTLEATRDYLPPDGMGQPAYKISEGSKWECKYKTETQDYVCCRHEPISTWSPWKYCLILDSEYNAFGFYELGADQYTKWSKGKQQLFKKIKE